MCAFEINFYSQRQEFHRYSTEDFALLDIGIGNYNRSSLTNFFSVNPETGAELKPLNPDIKEFFSNASAQSLVDNFLGVNNTAKMEIMAYDENEKKYKLKKGLAEITKIDTAKYKDHTQPNSTDIKLFLKDWHNIQLGIQADPKIIKGYKLIANRIQNSMSGCITFPLEGVNILNQPRKSLIRLYILDNKDADSSKTVSFNGSPFISAIPQTAEGMRYSQENTASAPVGVYDKTSGDLNNPKDKVAGQMRMVWVPSSRTWESGTQQIMARLIDDIDAATIPELTGEQLLGLSQGEVYDVPPEENPVMAKVETGRGLVVSTENGNPNLFGPNFRGGCDDNSKKSIINVVNRSSRAYKQGTLVVCSLIGDEWIIVSGEGGLVESKKLLNFGRFEFQQYIIPENLYFAVPGSVDKFMPDKWAYKWRADYYWQMFMEGQGDWSGSLYGLDGNNKTDTLRLTVTATYMPDNIDDPISYLINNFRTENGAGKIVTFNQDRKVNSEPTLDYYHKSYHGKDGPSAVYQGATKYDSIGFPFPKNALVNSNRLLALGLPGVKNGPSDPIDKFEIPLFWGMLFPDGYKSNQTKFFFDKPTTATFLKASGIYVNDPNLKELSATACASLPYFNDEKQLLRYIKYGIFTNIDNFNNTSVFSNPQDFVRKTGGVYRDLSYNNGYNNGYLSNLIQLRQKLYFELNGLTDGSYYMLSNGSSSYSSIFALEPINPRRLQFSPMSIDFLYSQSTLNNSEFATLKSYVNYINSSPTLSKLLNYQSLKLYAEHLWSRGTPAGSFSDSIFNGNTHNFLGLTFSNAFGPNPINSATINRHPPPLGVVNGGLIIPPPPTAGGYPRSPVIPILTCRSNISTNSKALTFTTFGYFGNPQKVSILPAQGQDDVIVLPIGGGLAWQLPNTPTQVNQSPQWGDRNRTDDIDSLGTTALHVRIFEAWPELLTIYLGPIFTPLHFNPSGPEFDYDATIENGQIVITDKMTDDDPPQKIEYVSEVDFKEPTQKRQNSTDPKVLFTGFGSDVITSENLEPFSDWKYNKIRRGKLLTGGGFAYVKNALFVKQVSLKTNDGGPTNRGLGYKKDDQFLLPDGSKIIVNDVLEPGGQISAIKPFEPNYDSTDFIIKNPSGYVGFNSTSITPQYLGNTGNGASFDYTITVAKTVGYDAPPKEVTPITRITKSSNNGENYVDGEYTTTVTMENTTKKNFDIFYFFHNDPTSYSLGVEAFNNSNAQYVISEVNPA